MTIELYTDLKNNLEPKVDNASNLLQGFDKNEAGLTIRTEEFLKAKRSFDLIFKQLQILNKNTSNKIKRQYVMNKNGGSLYNFKK